MAAMKTLTDPVRTKTNPVYISFTTRGWIPKLTPAEIQSGAKAEERVQEEWHGLADPEAVAALNGRMAPAAQVRVNAAAMQPDNHQPPPVPTTHEPVTVQPSPDGLPSPGSSEEIDSLVALATDDPKGETEDGKQAIMRLNEYAGVQGWTEEEIGAADSWEEVGNMAREAPADQSEGNGLDEANASPIEIGSKWMFKRRSKEGTPLVNSKKEEFPPIEVEVLDISVDAQTCHVSSTKDGKVITDVRTKKPFVVKLEWLEPKE